MKGWIVGVAATGSVAAMGLLAAQMDPVDRAICDLDGQFQKRFASVQDAFFGARRIPSTPEHGEFESLKPTTPVEKAAVARLRSAGRDALFMVAGTRALAVQRYAAESRAPHRRLPTCPSRDTRSARRSC